jgi:enoyl-CoA hydratase/carnithine racemase
MQDTKSPVTVDRESPACWRVTFDNPPLNLYDPEFVRGLSETVATIEADPEVTVVVFQSAVPGYFMNHLDLLRTGEIDRTVSQRSGLSPWPDLATRIAHLPCVTVASIRGRARGVGNEFSMALDVRFASRELAVFGQLEIGCGLFPGGGGTERLFMHAGRARALEVIVSGEDYDADTAERYGFVNRSLPDSELDGFVDRFATRVASFDRAAIATAKRQLTALGGIPRPNDLAASEKAFFDLFATPAAQARIKDLFDRGLQEDGDLERNLGDRLGPMSVGSATAS